MKINFNSFVLLFLLLSLLLNACKKNDTVIFEDCLNSQTRFDTAVLLVLGQSNAANSGEKKYTAYCKQAINFYNGNYYPLADPLKGANGDGGSVWSRLGQILIEKSFADIVIIAPAAIGGTPIQSWKPGGENNHLIQETILSLQSKGLKISHVLWHQGESNHKNLNSGISSSDNAQQYKNDFYELVAQLRLLGVDAPVFPAITTYCGPNGIDTYLEEAQRTLQNDSLGIFNGPNTDLLGNEFRYDNCHFNETGLKIHALLWANIMYAH